MRNNSKLHTAKTAKADVFFTSASAVESELQYYTEYFRDAVIFMNCNDVIDETKRSAFWNYFRDNHDKIRFKEIIATHYNPDGPSFGLRYDGTTETRFELRGHGEFNDEECIELLKESDIVVTNPPFSRFSHGYVDTLMQYEKKFLIIGSIMAITYKGFFPLLKSGKVWLGHNAHSGMLFQMSDDYEVINDKSVKIGPNGEKFVKIPNVTWYTNVGTVPPRKPLNLTKTYYGHEDEYPKYDNYDAINVDRCKDIPKDYYGTMGVPITFLCRYSPNEIEIVNFRKGNDNKDLTLSGKQSAFRVLIKRKQEDNPEQFEIVGLAPERGDFILQKKKYINGIQHNADGKTCNGSKVNAGPTFKHHVLPNKYPYYTCDAEDGYFTVLPARVLVKRRLTAKKNTP